MGTPKWLRVLDAEVVACTRCPRLVVYREQIAREKRRAYRDHEYWGKPVPGFGDPQARVLVLGLAPGAHGSNRTGRPFTGDASGNFMYPVLHETGFALLPTATARDDGQVLTGLYITAAYWFTASTSFANPALTLARAVTNTFSGIRPVDTPAFIAAQLLGAAVATALFRWFVPTLPAAAPDVLVPHAVQK